MVLLIIFYLALIVFIIASIWKTFEKAGQPGWAGIVPIYNYYIMGKIGGIKNWWLIFIPIVNIYIVFVIMIAIAKSFGKDAGFGVGLVLLDLYFSQYLVLAALPTLGQTELMPCRTILIELADNKIFNFSGGDCTCWRVRR